MMFLDGNMPRLAMGAVRAGLQLCVHAIDDHANREILPVYEEVARSIRAGAVQRPRRPAKTAAGALSTHCTIALMISRSSPNAV